MGKAKNVFYFNSDKSMYVKTSGNELLGIYNKDDEFIGLIHDKCGDMFKWVFGNNIYVIRWFKRKGFCAFYKITNNDISLREAEIWSVPDIKRESYKWWEGHEGFEEFEELYTFLEENKK